MTISFRLRPQCFVVVLAIACGCLARQTHAQELVSTMTPERIEEAIRLASDERETRRLLSRYAVQMRAGWGDGPRIGTFSTPFTRVVLAAAAARKNGQPFSATDVTPADLVPELHVVVTFQPSAVSETKDVAVESVVIARRGSTNRADDIQPLKTPALTATYQSRYGLMFDATGIVASFPLSAVASDREIRVGYREVVKGSSAASNCKDCLVPFPLTGIR